MPAQRIFRRSPLVLSTASARAQAESPPPRPARSHRRLRQGCLRPSWFNQNTTTQTIPLFLTFSTFSGSTPAPYPFASAHAHSPFQFLVDGDPLLTGADRITGPSPLIGIPPGPPFFFVPFPLEETLLLTFPLTPGVHSLRLEVEADGFAYAGTATPEPITLLLFGTTAAGLGLAYWRRRGRGRAHAA